MNSLRGHSTSLESAVRPCRIVCVEDRSRTVKPQFISRPQVSRCAVSIGIHDGTRHSVIEDGDEAARIAYRQSAIGTERHVVYRILAGPPLRIGRENEVASLGIQIDTRD